MFDTIYGVIYHPEKRIERERKNASRLIIIHALNSLYHPNLFSGWHTLTHIAVKVSEREEERVRVRER